METDDQIPDPAETRPGDRPGRRGFLTGGAAAAAAATAAVIATGDPAAAAVNDTMKVGQTNTGNGTTATQLALSSLFVTGSSDAVRVIEAAADRPGAAVYGVNDDESGPGVEGRSNGSTGIGVLGQGAVGVRGSHTNASGIGVLGVSATAAGTGVAGANTNAGVGVHAWSASGPSLVIAESGVSFPPTFGFWTAGSFAVDLGQLWYCHSTGTGTDSKWVKLSGGLQMLDAPVRVYDSRSGYPPFGGTKGKLATGNTRTISLASGGAVPVTATAALINLTVTGTSAGGFLAAYKSGISWPGTSSINWYEPASSVANEINVAVASAFIDVYCGGSGAVTDFIVDVVGFRT